MVGKKAGGFLLFFTVLVSLILTVPALASGLGVTPGKLDIELPRGGSTSATLSVTNSGNSEALYSVYVEEEDYITWFAIEPVEFTLAAGENRAVEIDVNPPADASGEHQAHICIIAIPPGEGLMITSGVKVPTTVSVSALPSLLWMIGISTAVVLAIILVIALWRRRARYS
jgi:P pilus assembly chaperone PapD